MMPRLRRWFDPRADNDQKIQQQAEKQFRKGQNILEKLCRRSGETNWGLMGKLGTRTTKRFVRG